jgi:gas vesicle protein GvpL/GvpF
MATAAYLYCIVHARKAPALTRVPRGIPGAGRPALRAAGRSLWVVIADVPLDAYGEAPLQIALRDMKRVAQIALAHEQVVEYFSRQPASTVVPMKLFTMFSSADRAVDGTRARSRQIGEVVKSIAGCDEWAVRIVRRAQPIRRAPAAAARPASGAAFLAARKRTRDAATDALRAATDTAQAAYETLAAIARDVRLRADAPDGAAPPLLDAAFLVPAARRVRFTSVARRLAAASGKAGAKLTVTGPWPAYNFVQPQSRT